MDRKNELNLVNTDHRKLNVGVGKIICKSVAKKEKADIGNDVEKLKPVCCTSPKKINSSCVSSQRSRDRDISTLKIRGSPRKDKRTADSTHSTITIPENKRQRHVQNIGPRRSPRKKASRSTSTAHKNTREDGTREKLNSTSTSPKPKLSINKNRQTAKESRTINSGCCGGENNSVLSNFRIPKRKRKNEPECVETSKELNSFQPSSGTMAPAPVISSKSKEDRVPPTKRTKFGYSYSETESKAKAGLKHTPSCSSGTESSSSSQTESKKMTLLGTYQKNYKSSDNIAYRSNDTKSSVKDTASTTHPASSVDVSSSSLNHVSDLSDYASDPDQEQEEMEWESQMPNILKLVQDNEDNLLTMYQCSESEVDMDVDMEQEQGQQIVIVADTNIWIGELDLLKSLLNTEFVDLSLTVIIPWMVLQELDVADHKKPNYKESIRKPINYIFSLLSNNHPRLKGQRATEAAISKLNFDEMVADDSILNCVFQQKQKNKHNTTVIFLSNDKNLLSKALVHGIFACDSASVLNKIGKIRNVNQMSEVSLQSQAFQNSSWNEFSQQNKVYGESHILNANDIDVDMDDALPRGNYAASTRYSQPRETSSGRHSIVTTRHDDASPGPINSQKLKSVKKSNTPSNRRQLPAVKYNHPILVSLLTAFDFIIRRKMTEDYGMEGWEFALKIKPPWNISSALNCIRVHWLANFSYVFSSRAQTHLDTLSDYIKSYNGNEYGSTESKTPLLVNNIVESACSLFNCFTDNCIANEQPVASCRQVLVDYVSSQSGNTHNPVGK